MPVDQLFLNLQAWSKIISMAATCAFAVTAVLAVQNEKDIDILGAVVLGLITAIGGGTIRDVITDVPVFWAKDLSYIWIGSGSAFAAFYGRKLLADRHMANTYKLMLYLDGFGAAMFGIQATGKVWHQGFGLPAGPVMLGVITAIGGGLVRDTLAGRTTLLVSPEIYATPVLLGCSAYVFILRYFPRYMFPGTLACIAVIFAIRAAAIHWNLSLPRFLRLVRD